MFYGCYALTDMDVSGFDTSSATIMRDMFCGCNALTAIDVSGFDTSNVTNMYSMFSSCSSLESIDITGFDTGKVRNISGIFAYCRSLTSLDLSGLNCKEIGTCTDIIKDCTSLIYLKTPVKAPSPNEDLPVNSGDVWYYANSSTQVGRSIPDASFICKNITTVPDDVEIAKPTIFISGVSIEKNKEYDAQPSTYSGTPIAVDSAGNSVENIEVSGGVYTGTLADGSAYTQTTIAPVKAGNYKLAFTITGTDADKYNIKDNSYSFTIRQKTVTVTAPTLTRELNENLTAAGALSGLCDLTNAVNGLLEGEDFITAPQFKYSAENIDTSVAGRYKIIPYGADVGNNYRIKYVNGSLTIGNPDYVPGGSDDDSQDDDSPYGDSERTDIGNSALQAKVSKIKDKVYDGMPYEPALKVTVVENGKKKTLVEGTDYRISYEDNTDVGTGKVIITGSGIYKGVLDPKPTFTIKQKPVKKLKIVAGSAAEEITAANVAQAPVYVYDGSKLLTESEDYSLSLSSKTPNPKASSKAKTYTINITGVQNSNYTGTTTVKVTKYEGIEPSQLISPAGITLEYLTTPYTGKARTPKVTVEVGNTPLAGKDYKVKYQNNKNAGTAYVIVTGKGTYKGTAVLPFNITANTAALEITNNIKAKTYNGKLQKPSVTVKAGKTKLKKNKDYMVSYSNNLHEGKNTAVVTVKGIGNYSGTAAKTFSINPQKISKVSVKGTWKGGLVLTYGNRKLVPNVDYAIKCDNIKKNKAKVTITAIAGKDFDGTAIKNVKLQ